MGGQEMAQEQKSMRPSSSGTLALSLVAVAVVLAGCQTPRSTEASEAPVPQDVAAHTYYLAGTYEVTWGQYKAYLSAMEDPEKASLYRHPEEPDAKMTSRARVPSGVNIEVDHPVRGVDWWDAYACARFFGGHLPTEAEWEKLAH